MQQVNTELLDLALTKYQMTVANAAKTPTLYKIITVVGKMVTPEYFSSRTQAELALVNIVKEKEKDIKVKKDK